MALPLAALLLSTGAASAGERLSGRDLAPIFAGERIDGVYQDGSRFTETYAKDGRTDYREGGRASSGQWSVRGDLFCTFYEAPDMPGGCFVVVRDSANCFDSFAVENEEEARSIVGDRRAWSARAWQADAISTCEGVPTI